MRALERGERGVGKGQDLAGGRERGGQPSPATSASGIFTGGGLSPGSSRHRGAALAYLVNCRSLASMLRCRMHMRVSAEPMSLVAPAEGVRESPLGTPPHQRQPSLHTRTGLAPGRDNQ